jgi:hypothetical protein
VALLLHLHVVLVLLGCDALLLLLLKDCHQGKHPAA